MTNFGWELREIEMKRISLLVLVVYLGFWFFYAEKKGWAKKIIVQNRITNLGNQSEIGFSIHNLEKGDSLTFDLVFDPSLLWPNTIINSC